MICITNIDELRKIIEEDLSPTSGLNSNNRFPIRIILLNSFNDMKEIIKLFHIQKIDLSTHMPTDLYWFSTMDLYNKIKDIKQSSIIYPVSEIIRFLPRNKIEGFISTLLGIENNSNDSFRIIVPIVGLENKLTKTFWDNYHRKYEGAKIWSFKSENYQPVEIYKMNKNLQTKIKLIENNRQWLTYWTCDNSKPLISTNISLNGRWDEFLPDNCFRVSEIHNHKELIQSFYRFSFPREYKTEEAKFWHKLLSYCEEQKVSDFHNLVTELLNVKSLSLMSLTAYLDKFHQEEDEFIHWLLIICIEKYYPDSYLSSCIKELDIDLIGIKKNLYYNIIDNYNQSHLEEREELISYYYNKSKLHIDSFIDNFIGKITDLDNNIKLTILTNITNKEKIEKLKTLSKFNQEDFMILVNEHLPEIGDYLNYEQIKQFFPSEWMSDYFKNYNIGKATNHKKDIINELISEFNENEKTFYNWYSSIDNLPETDDGPIYQIDGLGVEWLPFIYKYITKHLNSNIIFDNIEIKKSYIPSITSINKVDKSIFINDGSLDKYIHSKQDYAPFIDLINQIDVLKNLLNKIISNDDPVFYLTGDHGLSYQCLSFFERSGLQHFPNAEHEGRCYKAEKEQNSCSDFIYSNGYYIALNHNSLSSLPRREVHGGVTPEEVLIPLIKIRRDFLPTDYRVLFEKHQLSLFDNLSFKIEPKILINPIVKVNDEIVDITIESDLFVISKNYFKSGKNHVDLEFNGIKRSSVIQKDGAMKEEELF
ncbi:MAG: BREX-4 system phosphatase PglZ [Candidatus Cloacimonetes bacterium]|nr:BREX-4 system phosphatase PglZ [Candidatus Cloacimonadota bacterium]